MVPSSNKNQNCEAFVTAWAVQLAQFNFKKGGFIFTQELIFQLSSPHVRAFGREGVKITTNEQDRCVAIEDEVRQIKASNKAMEQKMNTWLEQQ